MAIDLDAARAARREGKGKGPVVRSGGKDYELPPEIAFSVIEGLALLEAGDSSQGLVAVAHGLFGPHYAEIVPGLAVDDFNDLLAQVLQEYGVTAPLPSSDS